MNTIYARTNELYLGKQGENNALRVVFTPLDIFNIGNLDDYSFNIINKRPEEEAGYPCSVVKETDTLIWYIRNVDNAIAGAGECQLNCFSGDTLLKSITYKTKIDRSVDGTGEVPEPYENILDEITELANSAAESAEIADNARLYASQSATAAAGSAEQADASAVASANFARNSREYRDLANEAREVASGYADNAEQYAESARAYRNEADTFADNALGYKNDAKNSADEAEAYAVAAEGFADLAETEKYLAVQAKNDAVQAKEGAEDARDEAEDVLEIITCMLPVDNESGNICNITDGANNLPFKHIVCGIKPRQSGSGDPSPTNVRSINGWLGTTLTRAGVNLLDTTRVELGTFNQTTGEPITGSGNQQRTTYYIPVNPGSKIVQTNSKSENNRAFFYLGSEYVSTAVFANRTALTVPNGVDRMKVSSSASGWTGTSGSYTWAQIEVGNSATDYKPFSKTDYDVFWENVAGTVYGGTLDVITGVLTVTHILATFSGSESWSLYSTTGLRYVFTANLPYDIKARSGSIDDCLTDTMLLSPLPATDTSMQNTITCRPTANVSKNFYVTAPPTDISTVEDLTSYLNTTNLHLYYPLNVPETYQLTPIQVNTVLSINNLWCDTGETSAEYVADIKLYIDKKIAESANNRNLLTLPSPAVDHENEEPEER